MQQGERHNHQVTEHRISFSEELYELLDRALKLFERNWEKEAQEIIDAETERLKQSNEAQQAALDAANSEGKKT